MKNITLNWIKQSPIFGNGMRIFQTTMGFGAENNYLQIMVEYGIFGLLVYYIFVIPLFISSLKIFRQRELPTVFLIIFGRISFKELK